MVLPVVARKKGLDGQYEQAIGSPKPKSSEGQPIKPVRMVHTPCTCIDGSSVQAPGTFGFDYTKYRPPRHGEEIHMREFGGIPKQDPLPEEDVTTPHAETPPQRTSLLPPPPPFGKAEEPTQPDSLQIPRSESPAPFSHYRVNPPVPIINITRPSLDTVEHRQAQEDEESSGGCCKCVIM